MNEDKDIKNEIIKKARKQINYDEEVNENCKNLIDKLLQMNYIGKNNIDIVSCTFDFIKEEIFCKYLEQIFKILEDNNLFTTFKDNKKCKNNILDKI